MLAVSSFSAAFPSVCGRWSNSTGRPAVRRAGREAQAGDRILGVMGRSARPLGDRKDTPRLRLSPQPLVLCDVGPAVARATRPSRQRGNGPPLAPTGATRVATTTAVLGPKDPANPQELEAIRRLLADLPPDETAVFEDEVEVNTKPTIGSM